MKRALPFKLVCAALSAMFFFGLLWPVPSAYALSDPIQLASGKISGTTTEDGDNSDPVDQNLSRAMMQYWTNFAVSRNPNGKGLPYWPPYRLDTDKHLEFGNTITPGSGLHKAALDVLDHFISNRNKKDPAYK